MPIYKPKYNIYDLWTHQCKKCFNPIENYSVDGKETKETFCDNCRRAIKKEERLKKIMKINASNSR